MSSVFRDAYQEKQEVPYGFMNTTMGNGHLNKYGHRLMADAIWEKLHE